MPLGNRFRHQAYRSEPPTSPYRLLPSGPPAEPSSPEFAPPIVAAGRTFGRAGVVGVYLAHGTFAGNDSIGLLTEVARIAPGLSDALRNFGKNVVDAVAGETGNYTPEYAARFEELIVAGAERPIPVKHFHWSSQNNHIGRADGAVRLIAELAQFAEQLPAYAYAGDGPRVLLWGHSHGGNVFAIASHLLGGDADVRREFFHASRSFYRRWLSSGVDLPVWQEVEQLLADSSHPVRRLHLDMVTFGTPIRYGWETAGYSRLLNIVNHRPAPNAAEHRAAYPLEARRMIAAADGDYVQHLGIAGTGLPINPLAARTMVANWRLRRLLQRGLRRNWFHARLRHGTRVPQEGATLLVDYDDPETNPFCHLFGHAAYTRSRWLPLHCKLVAEELYKSPRPAE